MHIQKTNFYVFTGGPGSGKTAVIEGLKQQNQLVVPEVARAIIRHQKMIGGNANHYGDRIKYTALMLEQSIKDFQEMIPILHPVYFDRGLPDLYSYTESYCDTIPKEVQDAINNYRYNKEVFLFPPWPEIYCHDTERKVPLQEAIDTWESVKKSYISCDYIPIEVPKLPIEERVQFILDYVSGFPGV